jgi:predicted component of type VI protein secretion system
MIPTAIIESLNAILEYNWSDEFSDYEAEGQPEGHVFEHLQRVSDWVEAESVSGMTSGR